MKLDHILFWRDRAFRSAAENMALDEALFHEACRTGEAVIRLYHWDHPAVTVGYFDRSSSDHVAGAIRRFTGGGLVEHGEDLTFLLALPAGSPPALASVLERYRWIHQSIATALAGAGHRVDLVESMGPATPGPCFTHPVAWDLIDPGTGHKIGGGAQRRSRGSVIHQGSIRLPASLRDPDAPWTADWFAGLANSSEALDSVSISERIAEARILRETRYGDSAWNHSG